MAPTNHHRRNPLLRPAQSRSALSDVPMKVDNSPPRYSDLPWEQAEPLPELQTDPPVESPIEAAIFFPPSDVGPDSERFGHLADEGLSDFPPANAPATVQADVQTVAAPASAETSEDEWTDPTLEAQEYKLSPLSLGIRVLFDVLLIGVALLVLQRPEPQPIALQPPPTAVPPATATAISTPGPITVFVSGAVQEPALYRLDPESRVADAIAMAGGLLTEADSALLNQAELLFDGAQVHVPVAAVQFQSEERGATDVQGASVQTVGSLSQPAAGVSGGSSSGGAAAASAGGLININTASADALTSLPGIGPSKAANIVAGRPYASVDDLERVSGIGAKTVDQLRDLVTAQ